MALTVPEIRAKLQSADEGEFAALERSLAADTRKGVKAALEVARRRLQTQRAERDRLASLYSFERALLQEGQSVIVGLDEVGRGAVAGPLAVGAVVLPESPLIEGLDDSKQIPPDRRSAIAGEIKQLARAWTVFFIEPEFIDREGMSASLRKAFKGALETIEASGVHADIVLIDGNPLHIDEREVSVVKGDSKCASIAAASIVAKVTRDAFMGKLNGQYPGYGLSRNKGYGSQQHEQAIKTRGLTPVHRKSFCRSFMQESLF